MRLEHRKQVWYVLMYPKSLCVFTSCSGNIKTNEVRVETETVANRVVLCSMYLQVTDLCYYWT